MLRQLLGDDIFERVNEVNLLASSCKDADIDLLTPLRYLDTLQLADSLVTDRGIQKLSQCRTLEWLTLDGTKATDETLTHLDPLRLQFISVKRTSIGQDAVLEFRRRHPGCEVKFGE